MKCKLCGNEIVHNGFKWIHGKSLFGSIEIGAPQPIHKAIPAEKNNKQMQMDTDCPKQTGTIPDSYFNSDQPFE